MSRSAVWFAFASSLVLGLAIGGVAAFVVAAPSAAERADEAGFRAFIPKLQQALAAKDLQFFGRRMETIPVVCTADDLGGNIGGPQCESVGQTYDGFPMAYWRSEGVIQPVLDALAQVGSFFDAELPSESDDFGGGQARVYAIDLAPGKAHAIVTALIARPSTFGQGGPLRVALGTAWSNGGDEWRLTSILSAYVNGEEFLIPCPEALDFLGGVWERYPDPTAAGPGPERCPS